MYVTLEPCAHFGKTPPCANALIKKGIKKVVIGMKDPNPMVSGKGISLLEAGGIEVVVGVMADEIKRLNEIFIKYITTKRPFCILKTAMTLDGKIATVTGESKWITNELAREQGHLLRQKVSGILVGIGTVLIDNPELSTRIHGITCRHPLRVIVDSKGRIPLTSNVLKPSSNQKTLIATTGQMQREKIDAIEKRGHQVLICPMTPNGVDLQFLMCQLGEMGVDSILCEGGATLNDSMLHEGIVDKVVAFIAPLLIGGEKAPTAIGGNGRAYLKQGVTLKELQVTMVGDNIKVEGYVKEADKCLQG